jgi:hypothetical protein
VLLLQIYLAILTVRVLLSWFRNIDWFSEPWNTLRQVGRRGCAGRVHQIGICEAAAAASFNYWRSRAESRMHCVTWQAGAMSRKETVLSLRLLNFPFFPAAAV